MGTLFPGPETVSSVLPATTATRGPHRGALLCGRFGALRAQNGGVQGVWGLPLGLRIPPLQEDAERGGPRCPMGRRRPKMPVEMGSLGFHPRLDNLQKETEPESRQGGGGAGTVIRRHRRAEKRGDGGGSSMDSGPESQEAAEIRTFLSDLNME